MIKFTFKFGNNIKIRITESTGILALAKPLDHENAAVVMFRVEVMDTNADAEFPNQTDTGANLIKFFIFLKI